MTNLNVELVGNQQRVVNENHEVVPNYKLSFIDEQYSIYSRGVEYGYNRVRCDLTCSLNFDEICDGVGDFYLPKFNYIPAMKRYGISADGTFNVVGYAKLNPSDDFDEEHGEHIAQSRAKAKAYAMVNKVFAEVLADMQKTTEKINATMTYFNHLHNTEVNHIADLVNE